jgi:hypothetical protein
MPFAAARHCGEHGQDGPQPHLRQDWQYLRLLDADADGASVRRVAVPAARPAGTAHDLAEIKLLRTSLDRARAVFADYARHRPAARLTIRQRSRVLDQWPKGGS